MTDRQADMIEEMAEILDGCETKMGFKIEDDKRSIKFNVIDDHTDDGYRCVYNLDDESCEHLPLSLKNTPTNDDAAVLNIEKENKYLFFSTHIEDIPFLHVLGISYLVCPNDAMLGDYCDELSDIPLLLMNKTQEETTAIQEMLDIETKIININFETICSQP